MQNIEFITDYHTILSMSVRDFLLKNILTINLLVGNGKWQLKQADVKQVYCCKIVDFVGLDQDGVDFDRRFDCVWVFGKGRELFDCHRFVDADGATKTVY